MVRIPLVAGDDPNALDKDGWTPLEQAIEFSGDIEIARVLLSNGASGNIRGALKMKLWEMAFISGARDVLNMAF